MLTVRIIKLWILIMCCCVFSDINEKTMITELHYVYTLRRKKKTTKKEENCCFTFSKIDERARVFFSEIHWAVTLHRTEKQEKKKKKKKSMLFYVFKKWRKDKGTFSEIFYVFTLFVAACIFIYHLLLFSPFRIRYATFQWSGHLFLRNLII